MDNSTLTADICVIGGGSAGVGAAAAALQEAGPDAKVLLIERQTSLGGTSTNAGVNCWEPGVGGPGLHNELARALELIPDASCVGKTTHFYAPDEPYGLSEVDPTAEYTSTLHRAGDQKESWRRFHFEPEQMSVAMANALRNRSKGRLRILLGTSFVHAHIHAERLESITVHRSETHENIEIRAGLFIDSTADIVVTRDIGCEFSFGEDAESMYGESSAPDTASGTVNGISLVFRLSKNPAVSDFIIPSWVQETPASEWVARNPAPSASINRYPNGDLNINVLPLMNGDEYFSLSSEDRLQICTARIYSYTDRMRRDFGYEGYGLSRIFTETGIRETWRLRGEYVLSQDDVLNGMNGQKHCADCIAFGDHALDLHGNRNAKFRGAMELKQPHGIPYSCILPKGFSNLAVACRGASFSHVAASSCRLSRTMMALGEAAGAAAAIAARQGKSFKDVKVAAVRDALMIPQYEDELARSRRI